MKNKLSYLKTGSVKCGRVMQNAIDFTLSHQLLDRKMWERFVEPFSTEGDAEDSGWRGEYFGKTMRGGCLIYSFTGNEELYKVLSEAVEKLLLTQSEDGRISSYSRENELDGWDMWCRKYVLTGLIHFYGICRDKLLKEKILNAASGHLDYIAARVGSGEDKKDIIDTGNVWGGISGLNSSSILEPVMELYKLTQKPEYLELAKHIIECGGSKKGNLIALAEANEIEPGDYPVTKAYEMMSLFEGLLAYYEVTGEERCFRIVENFADAVNRSEITVIGSAGCTHELFDHSALVQTEPKDTVMQETCVTVTWIRLCSRLYLLTGDKKYLDRVEHSYYNGLLGTLNTEGNKMKSGIAFEEYDLSPLPFDSYSPLYNSRRGHGTGGLRFYDDGFFYGCCACIASAGIALMPLLSAVKCSDGIIMNEFYDSKVKTELDGNNISVECTGHWLSDRPVKVKVHADSEFSLYIRKPAWCTLSVNSANEMKCAETDEYIIIKAADEEFEINVAKSLSATVLNGKIAFNYGLLLLARDNAKQNEGDYNDTIKLDKALKPNMLSPEEGELVRLTLDTADGKNILLTDYISCGKKWSYNKHNLTVWTKAECL